MTDKTKNYEFEGKIYTVPADATMEEVQAFIDSKSQSAPTGNTGPQSSFLGMNFPSASPPPQQMLTGALKGLANTGSGLLSMTGIAPETAANLKQWSEPQTGWEKAGFYPEQALEMMAPTALAGAATKAPMVAKLPGMAKTAAQIAMDAMGTGGVARLQSGSDEEAKKAAVISAAMGGAGMGLGKTLDWAGQKITSSMVRGLWQEAKDGFNVMNFKRYDVLGYTIPKMLEKVSARLETLRNSRNAIIDQSKTTVDVSPIFSNAANEIIDMGQSMKAVSDWKKMMSSFDEIEKHVKSVTGGSYKLSLRELENLKEWIGDNAKWIFGRVDPDSKALERVSGILYPKIRQAIEAVTPPGEVAKLNKQMQDLIPLQSALVKRIPVAERMNMLSVNDMLSLLPAAISGDMSKATMFLAQKASKAQPVGTFLWKHGQKASDLTQAITKSILAGTLDRKMSSREQLEAILQSVQPQQ